MKKRRFRKVDAWGGSQGPNRFLQLDYFFLETQAFRQLTGNDTKVLLFMLKRFNGINNGKIGFGVRSGCFVPTKGTGLPINSSIGLSAASIARSLRNLERLGFIRCTREAAFDQKRLVREWRLTWLPCNGELATKEFASLSSPQCERPKTKRSVTGDTLTMLTVPRVKQLTSIYDQKWCLQSHGRFYAALS